ncbi:hypothetical protein [Mesorhizobium sp.]|uniref:hypothetical protein n=2 Tax=Mesorhizobium TaxID=68287 RepID=UPI0025E06730|nr:hypothetical protein [Mesorhizobium sp.]
MSKLVNIKYKPLADTGMDCERQFRRNQGSGNAPLTPFADGGSRSQLESVRFCRLPALEARMNLLWTALLCAAMTCPAGLQPVRAEDQPTQPNGDAAQPAIHCKGQNCLPAKDDPALECKGQDCTPAPATDQPAGPEIKKVK